ncbi:uncharacterized protein BXZ73DRAFT_78177 [Epithele typhae]|uniref:uncharacterized protein n=1 Tax=Epithele typhae TaxID=378194 RepID=UPI0020087A6B|nr:uncharacterized protein BXZ73DRAFT_78177 [Epithele typhae]KAH9929019.1 hypothetical protein BXZ73DRAFT_78177 [Epithele typhae]
MLSCQYTASTAEAFDSFICQNACIIVSGKKHRVPKAPTREANGGLGSMVIFGDIVVVPADPEGKVNLVGRIAVLGSHESKTVTSSFVPGVRPRNGSAQVCSGELQSTLEKILGATPECSPSKRLCLWSAWEAPAKLSRLHKRSTPVTCRFLLMDKAEEEFISDALLILPPYLRYIDHWDFTCTNHCYALFPLSMLNSLSQYSTVTKLSLKRFSFPTYAHLERLLRGIPTLQELSLSGVWIPEDEDEDEDPTEDDSTLPPSPQLDPVRLHKLVVGSGIYIYAPFYKELLRTSAATLVDVTLSCRLLFVSSKIGEVNEEQKKAISTLTRLVQEHPTLSKNGITCVVQNSFKNHTERWSTILEQTFAALHLRAWYIAEAYGHSTDVHEMAFSRDGRWAVSWSGSSSNHPRLLQEVLIWDVSTGEPVLEQYCHGMFSPMGRVSPCAKFSPSDTLLAFYTHDILTTFTLPSADDCATPGAAPRKLGSAQLKTSAGNALDIAWIPESTQIAVAHKSGEVHVWDAVTLTLIRSMPSPLPSRDDHKIYEANLSVSPDGQRALHRSRCGGAITDYLYLWDLTTGTARPLFTNLIGGPDSSPPYAFSLRPSKNPGEVDVLGFPPAHGGRLFIDSTARGNYAVASLALDGRRVVHLSPDGRHALSTDFPTRDGDDDDGKDVPTGCGRVPDVGQARVPTLGRAVYWDLRDGRVHALRERVGHEPSLMVLSEDGSMVMRASDSGAVFFDRVCDVLGEAIEVVR